MLCDVPSDLEIKETVFSLSTESAPGPDGFTGAFFQKTWPIISDVVIRVVKEIFTDPRPLPRFVSATLIALIPKKPKAVDISDYRPISLCNFLYKIISTILNKRLAKILPIIISQE